MKNTICLLFMIGLAFVFFACTFPGSDLPVVGSVEFSLDLAYAKTVGYSIIRVQAALTHQTAGTVVQQDLAVDSASQMATGTIHNLRTGTWDVTVALFEDSTSVGGGTGTVTVTAGATSEMNIYIDLGTGSARISVYWSNMIPQLLSPENAALMDNGRLDTTDPIVWDFDWTDVSHAEKYHLYVIHIGAIFPVIDADTLIGSSYQHDSPGSYIIEDNRYDWTWKVRAYVDGSWRDWSPVRYFDVEPIDTD